MDQQPFLEPHSESFMGYFSSFHALGYLEGAKVQEFPREIFDLRQSVEYHSKQDARNNKDGILG